MVPIAGSAVALAGLYSTWPASAGVGDGVKLVGLLVTLFAVLIGAGLRLSKAHQEDQVAEEPPPDVRAGLNVLLRVAASGCDQEDRHLRVTLYVLEGDQLRQAVEYEGLKSKSKSKSAGRFCPIYCGVVGYAARTRKILFVDREEEDDAKYRAQLVKDWGFSDAQADELRMDRWSFMAIPLLHNDDNVACVIYLDSGERDYFASRERSITEAAAGVLDYLEAREK